jgi:hypothetical protein
MRYAGAEKGFFILLSGKENMDLGWLRTHKKRTKYKWMKTFLLDAIVLTGFKQTFIEQLLEAIYFGWKVQWSMRPQTCNEENGWTRNGNKFQ